MPTIFEIKATLQGSRPEIFRLLHVPGNVSLQLLHEIFQAAFLWDNYRLHFFQRDDGSDIKKEDLVALNQVISSGGHLKYVYDYGDSWTICISLQRTFTDNDGSKYPVCIGGARHAPPEDSGGITGYEMALELISKHVKGQRDYSLITEWYGVDYDPEYFSIEEVNRRLDSILKF
jgi:hypothetical protein